MAADVLSTGGVSVTVYDRMPSAGRKFLMAGRGGLNLTHSERLDLFFACYGADSAHLSPMLEVFPPRALIAWADALRADTFTGSSGRVGSWVGCPELVTVSPKPHSGLRLFFSYIAAALTGRSKMAIEYIHSYLVHPGKRSGHVSQIRGTTLQHNGRLFELLKDIYENADAQCDIAISFNPAENGSQSNPCRDLFVDYLGTPNLVRGRRIAQRLETVTTRRSGLGLLFVMAGKEGRESKFVISRFPTDTAVLAEEGREELSVQFLERVFMKSAHAYKAAMYRDISLKAGFWAGRAADRQINDRVVQASAYWIEEFLASGLEVTAAAGTRRFAIALRNAARSTDDVAIKSEIAAAVTLAKALKGRRSTITGFEAMMNLSSEAQQAINEHASEFLNDQFQLDWREFSQYLAYRSIELDNGGMLTAEAAKFDDVFRKERVRGSGDNVRFSTEGRVVAERLGKSKVKRLGK